MATHRRRNLIASRRPRNEEDEEDGEDLINGNDLDSLSDDSGLSDEDEEEEEDEEDDYSDDDEEEGKSSELKDVETVTKAVKQLELGDSVNKDSTAKINGKTPKEQTTKPASQEKPTINGLGKKRVDTEFMMNGFTVDEMTAEVRDFEQAGADGPVTEESVSAIKESPLLETAPAPKIPSKEPKQEYRHETPFERRRREHEEYKKRRDADPAFVPNRGAFFMHDQRSQGSGFRPFGRGRGGRGGFRGGMGFGRDNGAQPELIESPWKHDAYEEMLAAERPPFNPQPTVRPPVHRQETPRNFGRTQTQGTAQIIVNLPGMKFPITFSEVPYKVYTRLPTHRPPLRRDKPVRISLPDAPIKYIYPHPSRSFVFIPRAMRPGNPGFMNGNASVRRGGFHRGPTRSIYNGSIASQSQAMSRGSSFQPEQSEQSEQPTQSDQPIHPAKPAEPDQPDNPAQTDSQDKSQANPEPTAVSAEIHTMETAEGEESQKATVKPPPASEPPTRPATEVNENRSAPTNSSVRKQPAPTIKSPPQYPSPAPPIHDARGTPIIPMHQPRPQKTVSVADIETPASMHYTQYIQPTMYSDGTSTPTNYPQQPQHNSMYGHSRQASYPSQPQSGTPLSQIPERAVHAQPFTPSSYPAQPANTYYYSSPHQQAHAHPIHHHPHQHPHALHQTMYQSAPYTASPQYVSSPLPNGTPAAYHTVSVPPPPVTGSIAAPLPSGTIAQESNGTVYFYDPSTYYAAYAAAAYPGMGAPLTPAPEPVVGMGIPAGGMMYYYPAEMHTGGTVYYGHQ